MCFLQYGFSNIVDLRNINSVLEPYRALLVFHEIWTSTFSYQIFDFLNFSNTDLTLLYFLLKLGSTSMVIPLV
jgi:hypothetical protein